MAPSDHRRAGPFRRFHHRTLVFPRASGTLRLDLDADRAGLDDAVARLKPRLLILDPFVRLHRVDENVSGEVAPLRGSSEFHAWGDSNLYLRREGEERIILTVEHRAAASVPGVPLQLAERGDALALEPAEPKSGSAAAEPVSVDDRITAALAEAGQPQPFSALRAICRVRTATLYERLAAMTATGRLVKSNEGYRLAG